MKRFLSFIAITFLVANFSFGQDLFFTQYIEGSSYNKALEIYNPTNATVDLSAYTLKAASNGANWGQKDDVDNADYVLSLTGTLAAGDVYVVAHTDADAAGIVANADITFKYGDGDGSMLANFNGDDAVGLFKGTTLIDAIGVPAADPGTAWDVAGIVGATKDHSIVRKSTVTQGNTNWVTSAGTTTEDSEWTVLDKDDFTGLGSHSVSTAINNIEGLSTKIFTYGKLVSINTNMTNATVKMYNLTGKEVVKQTINKGISKISTSVVSGIYFVKVSNGTETATQKVFIK